MDVRPTKNGIFIAIDPCLHILLVTKFSLDLQLRASVPQELHRMTRLQGNTRRELQKKNVGSKYFQMIPSCPVILQHTAYYLTRSQLYLDLSMSNVTFLDLSIPFTTTAGHHFQVLT